MRSVIPSTPASAGSVFVMRPVALAMLVVGILFGGAMFQCGVGADRVGTRAAGILDDGAACVSLEECIAAGDEPAPASEIQPLVGPGFVDSFAITCLRTAAVKIQAPCGQVSYEAQVPAAATASVVFGDSAITASAGGIVRAAGEINGGNVRYEYCRTTLDAGVSINVRALCSSAP